MGINPDTYAPASPSSASAAAGGGAAGSNASFPATRHMAQWESARLEAEARLSRESLLFSSTSSAAAAAAPETESEHADDSLAAGKPEADFFLRIWNSEVGDAFRKPPSSALGRSAEGPAAMAAAAAESKSCVSATAPSGPDSSSSNEVDETSDETYQLYLNLAGDELGLFQGQMGSFSLFSTDLNDVVFLDTAFK